MNNPKNSMNTGYEQIHLDLEKLFLLRKKIYSRGDLVVLVVLVVFVGSRRSLAGLKSSGRSVGRISTW